MSYQEDRSCQKSEGQEPMSYQALVDKNNVLQNEIKSLRARLDEAEELKRAISEGDLDALVIPGPEGELVFTLDSADSAYRVLVETMNEGTTTLGFDGTILYCNRRFAELLKMPQQAIVGTSIYRFIEPESTVNFNTFLKQKMNTGEFNLKAEDGESLPVYMSISSLQAEGSPNAWCLVVTDLTEQKKNEEIIASDRLTRLIIEQSAETIVVCDTSGRIIRFSNSMLKFCRCDPTFQRFENLINLRFSEGADKGESILPVSSALRGSTILGMEAFFESENQKRLHLLLNSKPLRGTDGEIIGCVVTLNDITERKQAEEALHASEARYRSLYENSLDGILLTRPDGTVISANTQACNLHGMTEDEIIQSGREGLVVNNKKLAVALKERELTGRMRAELTCKRKDGSTFACDVTSNLFTDSDGSIMTSMIVRDITERKQTEKKLQENERKQQELIRSIEMERAQLEAVLDNLPVGVWIAGQNGHLIGKNKEADRIWAGDAPLLEDVEKYPQYTAWYADSGKLLMAEEYPVAKALLTGQPVEPIELRIRRFDNTVGTVLVSATPIKDKQGRLTGAVGINVDITERKKAEDLLYQAYEKIKFQSTELHAQTEKLHRAYEALSESEKKYRIIVETANEGIWTVNPEARTTYVNKKMAEMLGYAQDEMVGRPVWEFAYEESKAVIKRNLENREQGIDESYEFKLRRKDGSPLWTFVSGKSLFDGNGKFTGTMGMFTDISQRKGAETKLRETLDNLENLVKERTADLENAYNSLKESEKDLAEAQEMAHIGNWNWNIVTNELHWSDEVYRIFGLKPQEFKATFDEYFKYVHPEDRDHLNNAIKKTFEGEPYSVDNKIITANGEERIVHTDAEIIFNEDNIPVYARGIVQDITERKRAEEALRRSEERFRVALKGSRVVMFSQDLDLRYTWVYNPSPGFKSEDVLDKRDYDIYQPEDAETFVAIKRQVLASGVGRRDEVVTHRPISAGGNLVHEMTTEPLLDSTGAIVGIICVAVDITERKKAEEIMAKIEIARKQEIHHRIKNNLQVISSLLDLQADKFNNKECIKDSEVLEAFKESQNRVISMALIHEELYKGGEFETLNFSPYIKELAENLLQTYNLGDTDISLKLNLAQNVFFDMDTAVPLGIIVNELITNSFKHAFSGRKEGEIQIGLHREENVKLTKSTNEDCKSESFALIISDNGVGIPESLDIEDLDTLGMQLVVSLVDQLDGELETERDNGTKFIIRFTVIERNNQASALPAPIN